MEENRQKWQFCSIQGFFTELAQLNAQFIIGFMARENKHFFCFWCCSSLFYYYCLVYPYLQYCIIVWGSTYKTNLRCLVSLQKRVIRIISKSTFDSNSDPIFKELELLKLNNVRQLELGKLMFFSTVLFCLQSSTIIFL